MTEALIFDLAAVAILALSFIIMSKRGIIKCVFKLLSIVVTIVLVTLLTAPVSDLVASTDIGMAVDSFVYDALMSSENTDDAAGGETGGLDADDEIQSQVTALPAFFGNNVRGAAGQAAAPVVSSVVLKLICAVFIFLVSKLLIFLLLLLIEGIFKMPLLNSVNAILGGMVGLLSAAVVIFILCGLLSLDVSHSQQIRDIMDKTYIVKYFYDYNILMNLFLIK